MGGLGDVLGRADDARETPFLGGDAVRHRNHVPKGAQDIEDFTDATGEGAACRCRMKADATRQEARPGRP